MSNIKPGDLVVVTKPTPCCGNSNAIGMILRVTATSVITGHCTSCKTIRQALGATFDSVGGHCDVYRLTRINPLPSDETQDNHESLTA